MKFKPNYVVIPTAIVLLSYMGRLATSRGMDWYAELIRPEITPPDFVFGIVWTILYVMVGGAALIAWNKTKNSVRRNLLGFVFFINAVLNILWSYIFFVMHEPAIAFNEMIFLEITIVYLICETWRHTSKIASLLLVPYFLWVGFATYLTYAFMTLNS